jgi:hypothetical protein
MVDLYSKDAAFNDMSTVILKCQCSEGKGRGNPATAVCKGTVVLVCAMKIHKCGAQAQLPSFLISALDGGEWSASHPGRFISEGRFPVTHFMGG